MAALAAATAFGVSGAAASRHMLVGIFDEGQTLWSDDPAASFDDLQKLRVQVLRVSLYWSLVAKERPERGADPADPAYDWAAYDRVVTLAQASKIKIVFSIYGSPRWANGGKSPVWTPTNLGALKSFAYAAAKRYSGSFTDDGKLLPAVRYWLVWNEPNNPTFLKPQYQRVRVRVRVKVHGRVRKVVRTRWVAASPRNYARMCTAVYNGVHSTLLRGEKVACGATAPRGGGGPRSSRPSVSPLTFLSGLKRAGLRRFDAYAHHPYASRPSEKPTTRIRSKNNVTFGNLNVLIRLLTKLYGRKPLWITEYAYQTRPPDPYFGVSWALQAKYLTQAYAIARKNPRIAMMLWFLLKDEPQLPGRDGWQSGLLTATGKEKPAFKAFQRLPH